MKNNIIKTICHKCFYFKPYDYIAIGEKLLERKAVCKHPDCFVETKCINVCGNIKIVSTRFFDIKNFNLDNNCDRFRPYKIVLVKHRWWIFHWTIREKALILNDDKKEKDNRDKNKPLLYEDENTKFDNEHTIEDCKSKFNNVMNFGGAPKYHISEGKNNDINTKHRPDENDITSS